MLEEVEQALWATSVGKAGYCVEVLTESVEKLNRKIKLIKIADSSEAGWSTVKEYVTNPLASDSDDDKKLATAEGKAVQRLKENRKKAKDIYKSRSKYGGQGGASFAAGSANQLGARPSKVYSNIGGN